MKVFHEQVAKRIASESKKVFHEQVAKRIASESKKVFHEQGTEWGVDCECTEVVTENV